MRTWTDHVHGYGLDMVTDKLRPRSVHGLDTDMD